MSRWAEMVLGFNQEVRRCEHWLVQAHATGDPFFYQPIVTCSSLDSATLTKAWILFEQVSIEQRQPGGCWQEAQFRYSVWLLEYEKRYDLPCLLYQELVTKKRLLGCFPSSLDLANDFKRLAVDRHQVYVYGRSSSPLVFPRKV